MRNPVRRRLSYANVVATLALFLALGGGAYAAATITGADVVDNSLTGVDVKGNAATAELPFVDGTLTGSDIKDGAINASDINTNSIPSTRLTDNGVKGVDIDESSLSKVPDADKLDGVDSTAFLRSVGQGSTASRRVAIVQPGPGGETVDPIATGNGYTLLFRCAGTGGPNRVGYRNDTNIAQTLWSTVNTGAASNVVHQAAPPFTPVFADAPTSSETRLAIGFPTTGRTLKAEVWSAIEGGNCVIQTQITDTGVGTSGAG